MTIIAVIGLILVRSTIDGSPEIELKPFSNSEHKRRHNSFFPPRFRRCSRWRPTYVLMD